MKVGKIEKLENDIIRTEDLLEKQTERLKILKEELDRAKQAEILRICCEEGITVENIHKVISEYRREKGLTDEHTETEYEVY